MFPTMSPQKRSRFGTEPSRGSGEQICLVECGCKPECTCGAACGTGPCAGSVKTFGDFGDSTFLYKQWVCGGSLPLSKADKQSVS